VQQSWRPYQNDKGGSAFQWDGLWVRFEQQFGRKEHTETAETEKTAESEKSKATDSDEAKKTE
jgi:hypothetical protein